eukprot:573135-Pelagomonas_calceolata.AAC.1
MVHAGGMEHLGRVTVGRQRMADDSDDEEEEEDSQDVEESDEDIVDSDFLSGSDGDEGGDTPATGTPHHNRRRHQAGRAGRGMQDGGALVGAARRVAAALGRMERQRQVDQMRKVAAALVQMERKRQVSREQKVACVRQARCWHFRAPMVPGGMEPFKAHLPHRLSQYECVQVAWRRLKPTSFILRHNADV